MYPFHGAVGKRQASAGRDVAQRGKLTDEPGNEGAAMQSEYPDRDRIGWG